MLKRKADKRIVNLALFMSSHNLNIWYVCQKEGRSDVLVSDRDIDRFMRQGFKVESAFFDGKRYRNIYKLGGEIKFVQ